jgi:Protein of unknown function (DUF3347)
MKRSALVLAIAVLSLASPLMASDAMKAIADSYLKIQSQLVNDKMDAVKPAAQAIVDQAARMGEAGREIEKTAKAVGQAADLKAAREAFGPLSDAVIAGAKAEGWKDVSGLKVAYCPMANRSWLQKENTIRNPYYGSSMATCGEFKEGAKKD